MKLSLLTELEGFRNFLSPKLYSVFDVPADALSVIIFTSVVFSLIFAAFMITAQIRLARKRAPEASLHQKARRLRWDSDQTEVVPPEIHAGWYHLFLSHGDQSTVVV